MPYILYQVIKSLRENSALLVAANSSCFRSAEINCSLPFLNRPRRKRPARHWCEARKRPRSFVTDLDTQTSPSQPAHKLIFFRQLFFLGQAVQSLSFFFALFQKQPRTHNSTTCCNCPPQVLRALYEHKGKENDCHI